MDIDKYKMAVEFLIGYVEDFIDDTLPDYKLDKEFESEIKFLKKRIEIVRKFEGK